MQIHRRKIILFHRSLHPLLVRIYLRNTIVSLGHGFSFIANQYRLDLAGEEFFIDLLFFNRALRCLVA